MRLIDDWKVAWKYASVWCNTIGMAISGAYGALYEQLKETLPPQYMAGITAAVFVLGIIGRLVSQTPKDDAK